MGSDANFTVVRRGYDIDQVETHLRSTKRETRQRLDETTSRVEALEAELAEAKKREEAVHLTLVAATKTKEEMLEAAQRELTDAADKAKESGEKILSEAQFEAFRLVTQANQDAEHTIEEAKAEAQKIAEGASSQAALTADEATRITGEAQAEADRKIEEARTEALAMINEIREESERIVAERDAELARMRLEAAAEQGDTQDRAKWLLDVVGDLEGRLQLAAKGAVEELLQASAEVKRGFGAEAAAELELPARPPEPAVEKKGLAVEKKEEIGHAATAKPVSAPPRVTVDDTDTEPISDRPDRGSFYARRSARLPRIGPEAANGALAAVNAMRAASRESSRRGDEGIPEDSEDEVAMQTA